MPVYLETYTIPFDLPAQDLVNAMRRVNRGSDVNMLQCGYSLSDGKVFCLTEAPSEESVRHSFDLVEFPITLDLVTALDGLFQPGQTRSADVPR